MPHLGDENATTDLTRELLAAEKDLNLVQITNLERVYDVPKVPLKISSKVGTRIKSLLLSRPKLAT